MKSQTIALPNVRFLPQGTGRNKQTVTSFRFLWGALALVGVLVAAEFALSGRFASPGGDERSLLKVVMRQELTDGSEESIGGGGGSAQMPEPVAELTNNGAWSWFSDPRAVQYGDNTYIGWVSSVGDVIIGKYNHPTRTLTTSTVYSRLEADDHDNPVILIRPDRRLMVFFSKHAGYPMYSRLSLNPEDITAWDSLRTVNTDTRFTYANPFQLSSEGNTIYFFWRGSNWMPNFSTSTDGFSWSAKKTLLSTSTPGAPYVKYASNGTDTIYFAFSNSHPESSAVNSIYFMYYRNGTFYRANGTAIANVNQLPIQASEADLVYDSAASGLKAWIWDIALDSSGRPIIVYATFPSMTDHRYHYARWTGGSWEDHEITAGGRSIEDSGADPYYSGGVILDHSDPSVVYLSRQSGGAFMVEQWVTPDGGNTWHSRSLTDGSTVKNVRPIVPYGHTPGNISAIWMSGMYYSYTQFYTALKFLEGNRPPLVDAGPDQALAGGANSTVVRGFTYDDGQPSQAAPAVQWTQVSGPDWATVSSPTQLESVVTLPQPGTYVLRLTADDGVLTAFDELTITLPPPPSRPASGKGTVGLPSSQLTATTD